MIMQQQQKLQKTSQYNNIIVYKTYVYIYNYWNIMMEYIIKTNISIFFSFKWLQEKILLVTFEDIVFSWGVLFCKVTVIGLVYYINL